MQSCIGCVQLQPSIPLITLFLGLFIFQQVALAINVAIADTHWFKIAEVFGEKGCIASWWKKLLVSSFITVGFCIMAWYFAGILFLVSVICILAYN